MYTRLCAVCVCICISSFSTTLLVNKGIHNIDIVNYYIYKSLFTIMVAENKKSKRLNKLQQCEAKQLS